MLRYYKTYFSPIRHWIAVFGQIYQRSLVTVVDRLCARFKPVTRKWTWYKITGTCTYGYKSMSKADSSCYFNFTSFKTVWLHNNPYSYKNNTFCLNKNVYCKSTCTCTWRCQVVHVYAQKNFKRWGVKITNLSTHALF